MLFLFLLPIAIVVCIIAYLSARWGVLTLSVAIVLTGSAAVVVFAPDRKRQSTPPSIALPPEPAPDLAVPACHEEHGQLLATPDEDVIASPAPTDREQGLL